LERYNIRSAISRARTCSLFVRIHPFDKNINLRFSRVRKTETCNILQLQGKWKEELEKRLQTDEKVTLTAIGRIRYKLLAYLRKRKDIEIVKLETRYMKNRDKGIGIKVIVRRLDKHKSIS